jgi:hypothetical protein
MRQIHKFGANFQDTSLHLIYMQLGLVGVQQIVGKSFAYKGPFLIQSVNSKTGYINIRKASTSEIRQCYSH